MARRTGLLQTYPSKHSNGKVHRTLYCTINKVWYMACRDVSVPLAHGFRPPADTPVTCAKCIAAGHG